MSDIDDPAQSPGLSNDLEVDVKMEDDMPVDTSTAETILVDNGLDADLANANLVPDSPSKPKDVMSVANSLLATAFEKGADEYAGMAWKLSNSTAFTPLQLVEIKEQCAKQGITCLRKLEKRLKESLEMIPSSKRWIEKIDDIRQNMRKCKILIGFLGTTGAGKSSLINALLELEDLLPADDEKACTAVCVQIMWNRRDKPSEAFCAQIDRITADDWRAELTTLYEDVTEDSKFGIGDDDEPDLDRNERIAKAFHKLKCVYPEIKDLEDLKCHSVEQLMEHPNIKPILGKTQYYTSESLEVFAGLIKPFIDSSTSKGKKAQSYFAQWPLVKMVFLEVKSHILEDGVCLVDLPGSQDTNAARGAIAEEFQRKLSVSCIVAPTTRASSDKPAQELLGSIRQRTMQLDNTFTSDKLCFIVSKCDTSLTVPRYIKHHANVQSDVAEDLEREQNLNNMLATVDDYRQQMLESSVHHRKKVSDIGPQVTNLKSEYQNVNRKRKREGDEDYESDLKTQQLAEIRDKVKELQTQKEMEKSQVKIYESKLYKAQEKMAQISRALDRCDSRKTAACVINRNRVTISALREDYNAATRAIGKKTKATKPLQVFCVSSLAFMKIFNKKYPLPGFPVTNDTGIPALQTWLVESTLGTREFNAQSLLESIVSFEKSITPWLADRTAAFKMAEDERLRVDTVFKKNFDDLTKKFFKTDFNIIQQCQNLVHEDIFSKMVQAEDDAAKEAERTVSNWRMKPMHWGTHRTINRHLGTYTSYKNVEYKWNDELAGCYTGTLLSPWTRTIHDKLPSIRTTYDKEIREQLESFLDEVTEVSSSICPAMATPVEHWKESSLRSLVKIQENSLLIFEESLQDTARDAHRIVAPKILEIWSKVYLECGQEFGTGHYKRNQASHMKHVKENGRLMFKRGSSAIRRIFIKKWKELPSAFEKGTKPALEQIIEEFEQMMGNHTLAGDKETNDKLCAQLKQDLQKDAMRFFADLRGKWEVLPDAKKVREAEPLDEPDPTLDDLFAEQDGDEGDDFFDND